LAIVIIVRGFLFLSESGFNILSVILPILLIPFFFGFCAVVLVLFLVRRVLHSEIIWEINDNVIVIKSKFGKSSIGWATFQEVIETEKLYLLRSGPIHTLGSIHIYSIPKRIFESSNQESTFRNIIRSHVTKVRFKAA
jgi:hypothetical protein